MWTGVFFLAIVLWGTTLTAQGQEIEFRYVHDFTFIWNDRGSGADRDVSFWRPSGGGYNFYPLGDTAVATHQRPTRATLVVSALTTNALAAPAGFTEVWNDRGSGANRDVRVFRMYPPSGYTCLGDVAIEGFHSIPNRYNYRCVRSDLVIPSAGSYQLIWNDRGSGANRDVALWDNSGSGGRTHLGIEANTFTSFASHRHPSGYPDLLDSRRARYSYSARN